MIKGSVEERLEYEEYIHSLKDSIRYPFWGIYRESQKIIRYYWIKKAKEHRDFMPNEIQILHLMSLIDVAVRIGGLIYAWWWEEYITKTISWLTPSKVEWYVSADEIAECFIKVPTKPVEAALLKTNASSEVVRKALEAQKSDNRDALIEQLSGICLDEIFEAYKFIDSYRRQCKIISKMTFSEKNAERKALYTLTDAFEVIKEDSSVETQRLVEKITELAHSIILDEESILDNPELFIFALCIGIQLISDLASDRLGKFDPIAETLQEITEETTFQKIYNRYVQFPRDADRCLAICRKVISWMNDNFETNISEEELDIESIGAGMAEPIHSSSSARLEFPTRLISETGPTSISAQEQAPFLKEIYNINGGSFKDISCEEFLFLFGAAFVKQPASYNPPYYWIGKESAMKALLRILYIQQPRSLKELILHITDKETGVKGHNWSRNKNRVPYREIEATIIKVVHRITGKTLKEL